MLVRPETRELQELEISVGMAQENGMHCNGRPELNPKVQQMVDEWMKLDKVSSFDPLRPSCSRMARDTRGPREGLGPNQDWAGGAAALPRRGVTGLYMYLPLDVL